MRDDEYAWLITLGWALIALGVALSIIGVGVLL